MLVKSTPGVNITDNLEQFFSKFSFAKKDKYKLKLPKSCELQFHTKETYKILMKLTPRNLITKEQLVTY